MYEIALLGVAVTAASVTVVIWPMVGRRMLYTIGLVLSLAFGLIVLPIFFLLLMADQNYQTTAELMRSDALAWLTLGGCGLVCAYIWWPVKRR